MTPQNMLMVNITIMKLARINELIVQIRLKFTSKYLNSSSLVCKCQQLRFTILS